MGTSKLKWVPPRKKWVIARNVGSSKDWVVTSLRSAQSHKIFLFQGQRQKPKQIKTKQCLGWDRSNSKSDLNTYKVLATYYVYKIHTSIYSTKVNEVTNFSSSYLPGLFFQHLCGGGRKCSCRKNEFLSFGTEFWNF